MKLKLLFSAFCSLALITGVNMDSHAASSPKLVQSKYNPNLMVDKSLSVYMINGREIYEYFPELEYLREERFFANLARLEGVPQAAFGNMLAHLNKMLTTTDGLDLTHEIFRFTKFYFNHDYLNAVMNDSLLYFGLAEHYIDSIATEFSKLKGNIFEKLGFIYADFPSIYTDFVLWIRENTNDTSVWDLLEKTKSKESTNVYFDMFIKHKSKVNSNYKFVNELSRDHIVGLINVTSTILYKYWDSSSLKSLDSKQWTFSLLVIKWIYMFQFGSLLNNSLASSNGKPDVFMEYERNDLLWLAYTKNLDLQTIRENIKDIVVSMVLEKDPKQFEYYHGKLPEPKKIK